MHIRPAEAGDFEAVAALTNHYIRHTSIHFGTEPVSAQELRDSWEKSRGRYPFFVALAEVAASGEASATPRLMGYAKASVWRERAAYSWSAETGIYVAPEHHRKGVGLALYERLIPACREAGYHMLIAGVTLPNPASVALHERVGFVHIGDYKHAGWKFGAWHDAGFWQLMLRDEAHRPTTPPSVR